MFRGKKNERKVASYIGNKYAILVEKKNSWGLYIII